jgi:cysteinyl-tRNA synthetase
VTGRRIPDDVLAAAHARARARAARDWAEADRLRGEIEAAGFRIVDRGTDFALSPAHLPDVVAEGRTLYGSSASVPSRLADPPRGTATVVIVATDHPTDVDRVVGGLLAQAGEGVQVVVVGDGSSPAQAAALDELEQARTSEVAGAADAELEVVRTVTNLGHAAALNAGIRRAAAATVIALDPSVEPVGDVVTPLMEALEEPSVAIAGPFGLVTPDLRQFEDGPEGDVDAIAGYCQAFRRADYVERGPLDEHFRFYRNLDIWWSLVLRDEGPQGRARRAVAVADLPFRERMDLLTTRTPA